MSGAKNIIEKTFFVLRTRLFDNAIVHALLLLYTILAVRLLPGSLGSHDPGVLVYIPGRGQTNP